MIVDQRVTIPAPVDRVWEFVMNVPAVSRCVPGVESVTEIDPTTYEGALRVKVGPISVRLEGRVLLAEQDALAHRARMDLNAADKRVNGAVNAKMTMTLESRADGQTDMAVHTDASIMGKLGEFGQAVMRKKAEQIMAEFARNLSNEVSKE
jgi:uncharacterized protein